MNRIENRQKVETAWLQMAAAQGTVEGMKKTLKPFRSRPAGNTATQFISRLKMGIK